MSASPAQALPSCRRVLAAIDDSPAAQRAAAQAIALARDCGASLRFLHVADPRLLLGALPLHDDARALLERQLAEGHRLVDGAVERAAAAGVGSDGVVRRDGPQRVCDLVLREAAEWRADLVVIGTHGRHGLDRLTLGSEAESVLRRCDVPVLVVRDPAPGHAP